MQSESNELNDNFGQIGQFIIGLGKNQDAIFSGESILITNDISEKFYYAVVIDGHGTNFFVDFLRTVDWNRIVSSVNFEDELKLTLNNFYVNYGKYYYGRSGSTLIIMRAFSNRIETISIGDSTVIIYKNGNIAYKNEQHTIDNVFEFERLKKLNTYATSSFEGVSPVIKNSQELYPKKNCYNHFTDGVMIAMTQAIGHNGITGFLPERHVELYDPSDILRVIIGSDGLFDMLLVENRFFKSKDYTENDRDDFNQDYIDINTMNAEELCKKAEARWKKNDWNYHYNEKNLSKFSVMGFNGCYDDICCFIYDKKN